MVSVGEGVYAPLSKFGIYAIAIPENDIHPMPRWPSCCIPEGDDGFHSSHRVPPLTTLPFSIYSCVSSVIQYPFSTSTAT